MKFGITIVFLFISASAWSADAPQYNNNYYPDYAYNNHYNRYYQNSYTQPSYYSNAYSYENAYQQGYYLVPNPTVQNQYGYYTAPAYQPPVYYTPIYPAPAYQAPYSNANQGQANVPQTRSNTEPSAVSSAKTKPIKKPIIKAEDKAKKTVQLPRKSFKKRTHSERNKQFLKQILPLVINENKQIQKNRTHLMSIFKSLNQAHSISRENSHWLNTIAKKYRVSGNISKDSELQKELLKRVNGISPAMALAQAANESAWGTSRFSRQGNNLFGIWTYNEKIGIKPLKRAPGKKHFVRKFSSYQESVTVYMHTLNSHSAYKKLREIRHKAVLNNEKLSGYELAKGLEKYSAKGQDYIKMIQSMINNYDLENLALASIKLNNLSLNNMPISEVAFN